MTEEFIVRRAMLIANYSGIAVGFLVFMWFEFRTTRTSLKARFLASYMACYVTFVLIVQVIDRYITYRVYSFDHDGDQVFQTEELVGKLGFFWDAMIVDTARTFAPFTGFFSAAVGVVLAYGLSFACSRIIRYCRARIRA